MIDEPPPALDVELARALGFDASEHADKLALIGRLQDFLGAMPEDSVEPGAHWEERSDHLDTAHFAELHVPTRHVGSISRCEDPICVAHLGAPYREGLARAIAAGFTVERVVMLTSWVVAQDEVPLPRWLTLLPVMAEQVTRLLGPRDPLAHEGRVSGYERGYAIQDPGEESRFLTAVLLSRSRGLSVDGLRSYIVSARLRGW